MFLITQSLKTIFFNIQAFDFKVRKIYNLWKYFWILSSSNFSRYPLEQIHITHFAPTIYHPSKKLTLSSKLFQNPKPNIFLHFFLTFSLANSQFAYFHTFFIRSEHRKFSRISLKLFSLWSFTLTTQMAWKWR